MAELRGIVAQIPDTAAFGLLVRHFGAYLAVESSIRPFLEGAEKERSASNYSAPCETAMLKARSMANAFDR